MFQNSATEFEAVHELLDLIQKLNAIKILRISDGRRICTSFGQDGQTHCGHVYI